MAKRDTSADLSAGAQRRRYLIRSLLQLDFGDMYKTFLHQDRPAMMAVLKNDGKWDTSNALYGNGVVRPYDKAKPTDEMMWIGYGVTAIKGEVINDYSQSSDLAEIYHHLSVNYTLSGYIAKDRFYHIGTSESLIHANDYLSPVIFNNVLAVRFLINELGT